MATYLTVRQNSTTSPVSDISKTQICLLVIPGLAHNATTTCKPMWSNIERQLDIIMPGHRTRLEFIWRVVGWWDLVQRREQSAWKRLTATAELHNKRLRRLAMSVLATPVSYHDHNNELYRQLHQRLQDHLISLENQQGEMPIIALTHSFGLQIMHDYINDCQTGRFSYQRQRPFLRLETLVSIQSFGASLPLFGLAQPNPQCFRFPDAYIGKFFNRPLNDQQLRTIAQWHNYYDANDTLGYPIKSLSESYAHSVHQDHAIALETTVKYLVQSWMRIMPHFRYWTSAALAEKIAGQIAQIVGHLDGG